MLELERARKFYASPGGAVHAVDGLSMSVTAREFVAIFGPSGSGKTTLLLLAAGLLRADSGRVLFEGADLAQMSKRDLLAYRRTQLGFVFQGFNLVAGLTAEENAAMPLLLRGETHRRARTRAVALLDDVGLAHRARHTPADLSGGERQRLAIARVLLKNPCVLILDEATSALDSHNEAAIQEAIDVVMRGRTSLVIAHRLSTIVNADVIFVIEQGRIVESGSHAVLLARNGPYARLYRAQFRESAVAT